jgi:hypothetical protein
MAALVSSTPIIRHIVGDLSVRYLTLTGSGTTGDTVTVTGVSDILQVVVTPTTSTNVIGVSVVGSVITFNVAGAWTAIASVWSRVG